MMRVDIGGALVDRSASLGFTFDGRRFDALRGDTLASALLASGVRTVARSVKYHRPRGVAGLGDEEPSALVQLEPGSLFSEPNCRATRVEVYDGLSASSQNCWPSVDFDLGALAWRLHRFLPSGFYYKTFKWPRWEVFEPWIRRAAGHGRAPASGDPSHYLKRHAHCDVLVAGGGPAGVAAALAAAEAGDRVILAHSQRVLGGATTGQASITVDGIAVADWMRAAERRLRAHPDVEVLTDATVVGRYDHGMLVAIEELARGLHPASLGDLPRQRIWHIRAKRLVVATGARERPLVFPDNDKPGVMLASAVSGYLFRYAVAAGRRPVVVTDNDGGARVAEALLAAGVELAAILDVRGEAPLAPAAEALRARGVALHGGVRIDAVRGTRRVEGVRFRSDRAPAGASIDCDLLACTGGWQPRIELLAQTGSAPRFDDRLRAFVAAATGADVVCVGAAAGCFDAQVAVDDARRSAVSSTPGGAAGAARAPSPREPSNAPASAPRPSSAEQSVRAWWTTDAAPDRQWVDLQSDVTVADVLAAAGEGFVSVEHLKRYTTVGMATDQGKTSNVNALAILGEATSRTPGEVGTTRFRPPAVPLTLSAVAAGAHADRYAPRRTVPADAAHRALAARFEDFGGWQRPDHYPRAGESREQAVRREQLAVREGVGLFEASPIGKIEVTGADAARFLDFMYAMRVADLESGRARYGVMLNENGVVFDDGVCARLAPEWFLLSPTSGAAARVAAWLDEWRQCEFASWDVNLLDVTGTWASIAVAGPRSREVLRELRCDIDLTQRAFAHMSVREGSIEGVACRILRVSFSGELQFEVQVPAMYGESLWQRLMAAGSRSGIEPVGIEAWLRLRVEKGYLHVGTDTDGTTLPSDIGFAAAIARKPGDFVGRRSLERPDALRADREQLVGLEPWEGSEPLPVGATLVPAGSRLGSTARREGRVTSSCYSPTLGRAVALGLVREGRERRGERLDALFGGRTRPARVVEPAFYDPAGEKLRA